MKFLWVKLLSGGLAVASATGLGVWGVSGFNKENEFQKTAAKNENVSVTTVNENRENADSSSNPVNEAQSNPVCTVFQITNKGQAQQQIIEINWRDEKEKDSLASTTNQKFWSDVENACNNTGGKQSVNGKVYVTKNGERWNYSNADQRDWSQTSSVGR